MLVQVRIWVTISTCVLRALAMVENLTIDRMKIFLHTKRYIDIGDSTLLILEKEAVKNGR